MAELPDAALQLLFHGDGRDGHIQGASLARYYFDAGRSREEYRSDMLNPRFKGGTWAQERMTRRGVKAAEIEIERVWSKVEAWPQRRQLDPSDIYERTQKGLSYINRVIPPRRRKSALAVYGAIANLCLEHRTLRPMAAVRTIAERAGLRKDTVCGVLRHLTEHALITRQPNRGTRRTATVWAVRAPAEPGTDSTTPRGELQSVPGCASPFDGGRPSQPTLDCWSQKDLGRAAWLIYNTLGADAWTTRDLAASLGYQERTVERHLLRLAKAGLLNPDPETMRVFRSNVNPAGVATTGRGGQARLERAIQLQRNAYNRLPQCQHEDAHGRCQSRAWPGETRCKRHVIRAKLQRERNRERDREQHQQLPWAVRRCDHPGCDRSVTRGSDSPLCPRHQQPVLRLVTGYVGESVPTRASPA